MAARKNYGAFLSFAKPDRELVGALHELFSEVDVNTYFAPEDLPKAGTTEWRKEIIRGVNLSRCFLPIYTRHSLNRRWVLYESGVADSAQLERYPARVSGIGYDQIYDLPGRGALAYDLFDLESLAQLVVNVCLKSGKVKRRTLEKRVRPLVEMSSHAAEVIRLAKARWVFVAGNVPRGEFWRSTRAAAHDSGRNYNRRLRRFLENLTEELLRGGFNVASCPEVRPVGRVVARRATMWLLDNCPSELDRFQFGGIYPVDRSTRESDLPPEGHKLMVRYLMDFRKSYLANQEWVIVIGGSEGTNEEYEAGREMGTLRVFAVPCFGGAGEKICRKRNVGIKGPCASCAEKKGKCAPTEIVEYLRKTGIA